MKSLAAFLFAVALPAAAALPTEITAQYDVSALGMKVGRITESFSRKGDRYAIESVTRSEGPLKLFLDDQITLESRGTISSSGLRPEHFGQRRAKDGKRDIDATFDWARHVLVSKSAGETKEVPLPADTQDRLSLMYQFMHLTPRDGHLSVTMSNGRKVETYAYRFVERVRLSTPAGEFDTLHYARDNEDSEGKDGRDAKDRKAPNKADVWLAPERFNLPVRLVFEDSKGMRLEQSLVSIQAK